MDKLDFKKTLNKLQNTSDWVWYYIDNCTDEMSSPYWVRKTADYVLAIKNRFTDEIIDIKTGRTSKSHEENKNNLLKKYFKWSKEFGGNILIQVTK